MAEHPDKRRRLLLVAGLAGLAASPALRALTLTPAQSRGPFYPADLPLDRDNDLTRVEGWGDPARGTVADVGGRVLDARGEPVAGARIEIWQCDASGRYHHPWDRRGGGPPDPGFQGYGTATSGPDGAYRFRTIRPVPYPGRAPHIHFAIHPPGGGELVTQLYVEGAPENPRDFLWTRLSEAGRAAVTVPFTPERALAGGEVGAQFDIVLAGDGTPGVG